MEQPTTRSRPASAPVHYDIAAADPAGHLFDVRMTVARPDVGGQQLSLPAWIPGSYLIRDFARHIVHIEARSRGRIVNLNKLDKHTWQAEPISGALTVHYQVYAWDLSVRGAHLDQTHGFFNGTSVFLCAAGFEHSRCTIEIRKPAGRGFGQWRVATTLTRAGARLWGFGRYAAANYDELIDHPVEMGDFDTAGFVAGGARHEIVITGKHDTDFKRLTADVKRICEAQLRLFDPRRGRAPIKRYLFLTTAVGNGYGGLEHRASTALICARKDLPYPGMEGTPAGYQTFLGLASHEYFHTWNVKRIKPAAFAPYRLQTESYTDLLWVFEGFTAYYDDLMLVRSGVIKPDDYLNLLSTSISNVLSGSGRHKQSVAESSFDAWTRFYKQDENATNAIVSYYKKGAMVALALDLTIRLRTAHKKSLDDVLRLMWQRYGRNFDRNGSGIGEDAMPALIEQATGLNLRRQIRRWAYSTDDIELGKLLKPFGIDYTPDSVDSQPVWLGARLAQRNGDCALAAVFNNGPAHRAGVSAGDVLVSLDDKRIRDAATLNAMLSRSRPGQTVAITVFRGDLLHAFDVQLVAPPVTAVKLRANAAGKRRLANTARRQAVASAQ